MPIIDAVVILIISWILMCCMVLLFVVPTTVVFRSRLLLYLILHHEKFVSIFVNQSVYYNLYAWWICRFSIICSNVGSFVMS